VSPSFPCRQALTALWTITWMPARHGPVRRCSHARASSPDHGAGRGQHVRRTRIRCHSVCSLSTVGGVPRDGSSWLLVMSRRGCTSLLASRSCAAMPGVVGVQRGPSVGTRALARGLAFLQGWGEVEPSPERSVDAGPAPKGSGEAEPVPGG
jgi:hypothetical protein